VDYLDLGGLFHTAPQTAELDQAFRSAGVSAILGIGTAPGITNVQARYAADRMDTVDSIKIYDGSRSPGRKKDRFTYAVQTILDELTLEPVVFRDGKFIARKPMSEFEDYFFTPPLGVLPVHLSLHSEVATLPHVYRSKGIKEVFFKINYWGMDPETVEKIQALVDFGFSGSDPVEVDGQAVVPNHLMLAMLSGRVPPITDYLAPAVPKPPDWVQEMSTEVRGTQDGQIVNYRVTSLTCKSALPTGVAPAIASVYLAEGRIPPGVHPPETVIDPLPFFDELKKRGIYTRVASHYGNLILRTLPGDRAQSAAHSFRSTSAMNCENIDNLTHPLGHQDVRFPGSVGIRDGPHYGISQGLVKPIRMTFYVFEF
jgi:saccharopine dehydrogenase (NAD+, L-lysine-forming)